MMFKYFPSLQIGTFLFRIDPVITLIQTVWFRVMTFVWFPPPPGKENNFNLKVFFLQRIAAANRRTKKVPRILERKYSKLGTSDVAAFGNKKQLRTVKGVKFA